MFENLELLKAPPHSASEPALRAMELACSLAALNGARVYAARSNAEIKVSGLNNPIYSTTDVPVITEDPARWARSGGAVRRVVLTTDDYRQDRVAGDEDVSVITIESPDWQSEETLFAESGIAHLLGAPDRPPLIPDAHYAAHSVGYAVFAALTGVYLAAERHGVSDSATVNALAVMAWINWKAGAAGAMGRDLKREGASGAWPVLPCADGYVAFLFTDRDWPNVVEMVSDDRLKEDTFSTSALRTENRPALLGVFKDWLIGLSKAEANEKMLAHGVPGAAVEPIGGLLEDPLLAHRQLWREAQTETGKQTVIPRQACRIELEVKGASSASPARAESPENTLPLSGMRVIDFGIITAGAGVTAVLADLGAEVIKVESSTYPDPFRFWMGSDDSPLFKFNNRNKFGVDIDLKTQHGIDQILDLVEHADIVVENFRRGVLDRRGLTFAALRRRNPNILLASVSGQGLHGPGTEHATFGSTLEANSGFAELCAYDDGVPHVTGVNLNYPDQIVCVYAAAMIAAHAHECREKSVARHIDIAQRDCVIYQIGDLIAEQNGALKQNRGANPGRVFATRDDQYVALSANALAAYDEIFGVDGADPVAVKTWMRQQNAANVTSQLTGAGYGAAICLKGSEMIQLPQIENRDVFRKSPNGDLVKGFPFQFARSKMTIHGDAPTVGRHTDFILSRLGGKQ